MLTPVHLAGLDVEVRLRAGMVSTNQTPRYLLFLSIKCNAGSTTVETHTALITEAAHAIIANAFRAAVYREELELSYLGVQLGRCLGGPGGKPGSLGGGPGGGGSFSEELPSGFIGEQ